MLKLLFFVVIPCMKVNAAVMPAPTVVDAVVCQQPSALTAAPFLALNGLQRRGGTSACGYIDGDAG